MLLAQVSAARNVVPSLSALQLDDKAALVRHLADPAIAALSPRIPYPYTAADALAWIRAARARQLRHGRPMVWAIRDFDGELVGCAAFHASDPRAPEAELGYWLARTHWGRGTMTAVVRELVRIGLERYGWASIRARVLEGNRASARVLEKCGFRLVDSAAAGERIYRLRGPSQNG